jgi:hypothetical protein
VPPATTPAKPANHQECWFDLLIPTFATAPMLQTTIKDIRPMQGAFEPPITIDQKIVDKEVERHCDRGGHALTDHEAPGDDLKGHKQHRQVKDEA